MATFLPEALKRFKENYPDFKPDNVRLIDANALKERMNSDFWSNTADLVDALEIIDSAPTVDISELEEKAKSLDDINRKIRQLGNKGL